MSANGEFAGQLPVAEDLDSETPSVGQSGVAQADFIDTRAILKLVEGLKIDRQVTSGMAGVVEPALGNTPDERHLTALKTDADGAAGAGGLSLPPTAAGFSVTAGFALAKPFATVFGSRTRFEIV